MLRATNDRPEHRPGLRSRRPGRASPVKWTALRDALRRGDIAQALTQIAERSRGRYQQAFTALTPDLPAIDAILTDVEVRSHARSRGDLRGWGARTPACSKSFEVRFQVDADGFWRVRSF